jgi:hypothetical protein
MNEARKEETCDGRDLTKWLRLTLQCPLVSNSGLSEGEFLC